MAFFPLRSCFHATLSVPSQAVTDGKREKRKSDLFMGVGEVGQGMVSVNLAHFFKDGAQHREEFVNFTENVAGKVSRIFSQYRRD